MTDAEVGVGVGVGRRGEENAHEGREGVERRASGCGAGPTVGLCFWRRGRGVGSSQAHVLATMTA